MAGNSRKSRINKQPNSPSYGRFNQPGGPRSASGIQARANQPRTNTGFGSFPSDYEDESQFEEELEYVDDFDHLQDGDEVVPQQERTPVRKPKTVRPPARQVQQYTRPPQVDQFDPYADEYEPDFDQVYEPQPQRYVNPTPSYGYQEAVERSAPPTMSFLLASVGAIIAVLLIIVFTFFTGLNLGSRSQGEGLLESAASAGTTNQITFSASSLGSGQISPFFAPSVQYWESEIVAWGERHNLDPNIIATVMQVESCGDPQALSGAGAMGLFQVMPYHFQDGEDSYNPDINALRGMNYLAERLIQTNGDIGRAFAGYNGGQAAAASGWNSWANETQRYYTWTTGIYGDASSGNQTSDTLNQWFAAGGSSLCAQAEQRLNIN